MDCSGDLVTVRWDLRGVLLSGEFVPRFDAAGRDDSVDSLVVVTSSHDSSM